jgi:RNA polymerase sigma-70 factor (ECF subfamily)
VSTAPALETVVDAAFFDGIYDSELAYVFATLRRLGIPERDLEDVAHDVFVIVYRRLGDYDRARPLRPWLFGIAFRVASEYRRSSGNKRELLRPAEEPSAEPEVEGAIVGREDRELIHRALDALDLGRRAVLVMHEIDGVAAPEIALVLGIPVNTVYSRLRTAREELTAAVMRLTRRER